MAKPERNVSGELLALPFVSDEPCALRVDDALGFDPFRQTTQGRGVQQPESPPLADPPSLADVSKRKQARRRGRARYAIYQFDHAGSRDGVGLARFGARAAENTR